MKVNIFVYGTLKKGHYNSHLTGTATSRRVGYINGDMYSLGGFPCVVLDEDSILCNGSGWPKKEAEKQAQEEIEPFDVQFHPVVGEFLTFDVEDRALTAIDRLEGFIAEGGGLYEKALVRVHLGGDLYDVAWVYHMPEGGCNEQVKSNLW